MSQQEALLKSRSLATWMGFNLDQKGLQSFMGTSTNAGPAGKLSTEKQGPDAETSRREALRLAATFAKLR